MSTPQPNLGSVLVLGGCGFLGHNIVAALLKDPSKPTVSVFSRNPTTNLYPGVSYHAGDITSASQIRKLLSELKPRVIINSASLLPPLMSNIPDDPAIYKKINVDGTANLLACAAEAPSVVAFVHTSSLSVVIPDSKGNINYADETAPTVQEIDKHNPYEGSKALSEALVLAANNIKPADENGLRTCSLRVTGVYGEGDWGVTWNALDLLKMGRTRYHVGSEGALYEAVAVENAAHAHVLAAKALLDTSLSKKVDGEIFNISDGQPMPIWELMRTMWSAAGYEQTETNKIVIPTWLVLMVTSIIEWSFWIFTLGYRKPSVWRRSHIEWVCLRRTFNIAKAKDRLGYVPIIEREEAAKKAMHWAIKVRAGLEMNQKTK
jgi:sterol-4alpha-carboxylate 3-dehydrogenase (decarboxylating)